MDNAIPILFFKNIHNMKIKLERYMECEKGKKENKKRIKISFIFERIIFEILK